jgi:hypothetical protein
VTNPLAPIFDAFTQLRADWPKRGWSWDNRLNCVASSFDIAVMEQAQAAVSRALPTLWTDRTMAQAPAVIRDVAERSGGVRAGQLIYTGTAVGSVVPYGLWWPWGNEATISLRVGLVSNTDMSAKLCALFGTEP